MLIKIGKSRNWGQRKDILHKRRKELAEGMRPGLMSRGQMMRGHNGDGNEDRQTEKYDQWKQGGNEGRMKEWSDINREFKTNGEEGKVMSIDSVRDSNERGKNIKYD